MDFTPRSEAPTPAPSRSAGPSGGSKRSIKKWNKPLKWLAGFLLVSTVILVVAIIISIAFSDNKGQSQYVKSGDMQAVFLNGGQVYFGQIGTINDEYMTLSNIYYLRVNQQVQPGQTESSNDVSLVKLGCELHGPQDQMVINNDQVIFWENLKNDGQVVKAVQEYVKQNPNGQNCNTEQQQGQTNNTTTNNQ